MPAGSGAQQASGWGRSAGRKSACCGEGRRRHRRRALLTLQELVLHRRYAAAGHAVNDLHGGRGGGVSIAPHVLAKRTCAATRANRTCAATGMLATSGLMRAESGRAGAHREGAGAPVCAVCGVLLGRHNRGGARNAQICSNSSF